MGALYQCAALPLPVLPDGRRPLVSSSYEDHQRRRPASRSPGSDWVYRRLPSDPDPVGDGAGFPKHVVPDGVYFRAIADGVVVFSGWTDTGWQVTLEHASDDGPWQSVYLHGQQRGRHALEGAAVRAGVELAMVGDNPSGRDGRHLHLSGRRYRGGPWVNLEPYLIGDQAGGVVAPRTPSPALGLAKAIGAALGLAIGAALGQRRG